MPSQKIFELAIAPQTAKGVAATAADFKTRVSGGDIAPMANVPTFAETGRTRLPRTAFKASSGVDGAPAMAMREDLMALLLWGALGDLDAVGASTALAAAASAGATNIKVDSIAAIAVNDRLLIGTGGTQETGIVSAVGTAGSAGTGVTLTTALANAHALGAPVVEDPTLHTANYANLTPYFTVWRMFGDFVWEKFIDCKIAQLEIVSEAEQAVVVTATIVGTRAQALDQATYNTEVAVAYTDTPIYPHHFASGLLAFEGTVVSTIERVAITIANGTTRQFGDSIYADDVTEGAANITIATRQRVSAPDLYNRLHYGSATPVTGTDPTGNVIELGAPGIDLRWRRQTTPERSVRFQASRLQITSIGAFTPGTGDDPIRMEPTYTVFDPTTGEPFTATVMNGLAASAYTP